MRKITKLLAALLPLTAGMMMNTVQAAPEEQEIVRTGSIPSEAGSSKTCTGSVRHDSVFTPLKLLHIRCRM